MRWASIDSVVRDMVDASKRWRPNYIEMVDETFTISKKYTLELCEALIEANFDTPWGAKDYLFMAKNSQLFQYSHGTYASSK